MSIKPNIYELSQRAKELYLKAKAKGMVDEQRALIRFIFATLTVDEGKLSYTYSKTFKILSEAVEVTNGSKVDKIDDFENRKFELTKQNDITEQKDSLLPSRPIWLPLKDLFCNHKLEFDISLDELKIFASQLYGQKQYQYLSV